MVDTMVLAVKFPDPSLCTMLLAILESVDVVQVGAPTPPEVRIRPVVPVPAFVNPVPLP